MIDKKHQRTVIDLNIEGVKEEQIIENALLENSLNMSLYAFGKWGEIKGLKVEKDYERLNSLINSILFQIDISAELDQESFRFYEGNVQITYEEVIQKILDDNPIVETAEEQSENNYEIGLWHKIVWESGEFRFAKSELTQKEKLKFRLGNNFYVVNYKCPKCGQKMFMVIYPVGDEFKIETSEGGVFLSRAYTCSECNLYYTPKPGKLLMEGEVFFLDFEDDKTAYEDYQDVLGKQGARTANCNFNKYENQYVIKEQEETIKLEEIIENIEELSYEEIERIQEQIESGFFPEASVEKYIHVVKKALAKSKPTKKKKEKQKLEAKSKKTIAPQNQVKTIKPEQGLKIKQHSEATKKILKEVLSEDRDYFIKRLANLNDEEIQDLKSAIQNESSMDEEQKKIYINNIDKILYKDKEKELIEKAATVKGQSYEKIVDAIREIKQEKDCAENIKAPIIETLKEMSEKRGKKELEYIISKIPVSLTKSQYKQLEEKINQYKEIDIKPYKKLLEDKWDEIEKKKINEFIKSANLKDRKSFYETYKKLKEQAFEERNVKPYIEKIYKKIYDSDQAAINRIFSDDEDMRFSEVVSAYEKIELGDFLPEIKSNTLELIDKRLTKMKMDECEQLVNKLNKEISWLNEEKSKIYLYKVKKMARKNGDAEYNIITNAINKYAINKSKYEYPILISDSSFKGNGTKGFILTPDHIFYNTAFNSGKLDITNVAEITFNKHIYANLKNGEVVKLKNKLSITERENFSKTLNEFIEYLNEKPESRSVKYMAAEKHQVKCCYRCGNVYKDNDECPKCGAKFND